MKDTDLEFFRHFLTEWLEELLAHTDNSVESLLDPRENLPDPMDGATAVSDRAWILRIRDRERMLIKKIPTELFGNK